MGRISHLRQARTIRSLALLSAGPPTRSFLKPFVDLPKLTYFLDLGLLPQNIGKSTYLGMNSKPPTPNELIS